jgi:redox-sensitive bicupin YhaK (pirin superfamily)
MSQTTQAASSVRPLPPRPVLRKTRGQSHGTVIRLMSPSDLGQVLKPFVFLDLVEADTANLPKFPKHPHSGIATVSVVTKGSMRFHHPTEGEGVIAYGGLEWMRAGGGIWHGDEASAGDSPSVQAFQLWVALPPELENGPSLSQFIDASCTPTAEPARVMVGEYGGAKSPAQAPAGITYLLVTLAPGETWTFEPPAGQAVAFLAVAQGALDAADRVSAGELAIFEQSETPIVVHAGPSGAVFVIGAAIPHPHDLVLGHYSVHTSAAALKAGEARIEELRPH